MNDEKLLSDQLVMEEKPAKKAICLPNKFYTKLPNYSLLSISLRLIFITITSTIVLQLIVRIYHPEEVAEVQFHNYVMIVFFFLLLSESLIVADNILERFLPIPHRLPLRVTLMILTSIILVFIDFLLFEYVFPKDNFGQTQQEERQSFFMGVALGLVFVTMLSQTLLITRFTEKWVHAQKNIDQMKREKLRMDYNILQDQLNPHFLFNNLSVLKSLIMYDTDTAIKFTEDFTDVYRYVLQSKNKMLINLKSELEFIYAYIGLHKERLGNGLIVDFSIDRESIEKDIAPLTAQLLVENAIKHNIASKEKPLKLEIRADDSYFYVENTINLRETSYSTKTGLTNLVKRYEILTDIDIIIESDEDKFLVKIPLI